jgi:hypothetical protein
MGIYFFWDLLTFEFYAVYNDKTLLMFQDSISDHLQGESSQAVYAVSETKVNLVELWWKLTAIVVPVLHKVGTEQSI